MFYQAQLPIQFQGKRLHWSVITCTPGRGPATARQPAEVCSETAARTLAYLLPLPVLSAPANDLTLPDLEPRFAWSYGNPQGVDHFLVCVAARGAPCPATPTLQPLVFVAQVQSGFEFTAPKDFAPFLGQTLHWTVGVCNAEVGCAYQPDARRIHVPLLKGSFDAVYPLAQHPKCKNCHQMRDGNEMYQTHIRLGRFTAAAVPPQGVGNIQVCRACHTAGSGFTDAWRAPTNTQSFDVPISNQFCMVMQTAPFADEPLHHLTSDSNILWAAARIPGVGVDVWRDIVTVWYQFGRKTYWSPAPCLCAGKFPCDGRSHGQFTP